MPPRVSVIMPVFNALPFLGEAVDSILDQSFTDFELIAVDDGSTDGSLDLLRQRAGRDDRVVVHTIEHGGIVAALNSGLAVARGELVARMDADDRSIQTRLAEQVAFLDAHPEVAAVGTDLLRMDQRGGPIRTGGVATEHEQIEASMLTGRAGAMTHATTMTRRSAIDAAGGGYNPQFRHAEDLDLFLRVAEHGRLANLDRVLYEVRMHLGSITRTESIPRLHAMKTRIVTEARARRGLPDGPVILSVPGEDRSPIDHRLAWARRAAGAENMKTARRHARGVLVRAPWRGKAWVILVRACLPGWARAALRRGRDRVRGQAKRSTTEKPGAMA